MQAFNNLSTTEQIIVGGGVALGAYTLYRDTQDKPTLRQRVARRT
jgi:hypothetical protein